MKNYYKLLLALVGIFCLSSNAYAQETGEEIYTDYCEACHQPGGEGFEDTYPALKENVFVLGDTEELIYLMLEGRGGMPTFIEDLEVEQITTILNYIRTSWGNAGDEIDPAVVEEAFDFIAEEDDGFGPGN
ncbi:MAG: cytochrome c [Kordiimonadaceae bacterium]|nr:cytochrome c [Kordiimonadaceae bacterium]MBT6036895.1 cytochrome c [Kordiimonadaceae bacterium]MBT6328484.1 cytochrome c [Kordiimonadaceae bacterium]MBT7583717.1 cytochrome c [Kordiimonadaceae bacterium]